jgi:hypothetical protein
LGDPSVTPSVADMGYQRLPYEDAATTTEMASDCAVVGRAYPVAAASLDGPLTDEHVDAVFHAVVVSDELAELAAGLELHFD